MQILALLSSYTEPYCQTFCKTKYKNEYNILAICWHVYANKHMQAYVLHLFVYMNTLGRMSETFDPLPSIVQVAHGRGVQPKI